MRNDIQTRRKAGLIEKAVKLHKHGYDYASISKMVGISKLHTRRWIEEYLDFQAHKDPDQLLCIKRCVPHFKEVKPKEKQRKKITILWGLITIN